MYVYKLLDGGMYADFQRYEAARISIPFFLLFLFLKATDTFYFILALIYLFCWDVCMHSPIQVPGMERQSPGLVSVPCSC